MVKHPIKALMPHVTFVVLIVDDARKAAVFYESTLGALRKSSSENQQYFALDIGDISLGLVTRAYMAELAPSLRTAVAKDLPYSSFISFRVSNISLQLQKITEAGGQIIEQPQPVPWGGTMALISDLDGNLVELFEKTP